MERQFGPLPLEEEIPEWGAAPSDVNITAMHYSLLYEAFLSFLSKGHAIWLSTYSESPVFFVPDEKPLSPALEGFYKFWTMIILLQVISQLVLLTFRLHQLKSVVACA